MVGRMRFEPASESVNRESKIPSHAFRLDAEDAPIPPTHERHAFESCIAHLINQTEVSN